MESPWQGRFLNRQRFFNRHYYVIRDDITDTRLDRQFDCVTCLNILALVEDHRAALRGMFSLLRPGGFLIISCPYNEHEFVPDAYSLPGAGYGQDRPVLCRQYSRAELDGWLAENGGVLVEQELYRCFSGKYWTMGERIVPPEPAGKDDPHHMTCLLIRKEPAA
jgi:SAM-dependent methyltransferase